MPTYLTSAFAASLLFASSLQTQQSLHAELKMQEVCDKEVVKRILRTAALPEVEYVSLLASRCLDAEDIVIAFTANKSHSLTHYDKAYILVKSMVRYGQIFYLEELPEIVRKAELARRMSEDDSYASMKSYLSADVNKNLFHFLCNLAYFSGYASGYAQNFRRIEKAQEGGHLSKKEADNFKLYRKNYKDFLWLHGRLAQVSAPLCKELTRVLNKEICAPITKYLKKSATVKQNAEDTAPDLR